MAVELVRKPEREMTNDIGGELGALRDSLGLEEGTELSEISSSKFCLVVYHQSNLVRQRLSIKKHLCISTSLCNRLGRQNCNGKYER
tara:strand:+ start:9414 stop:9674 length:261 start_codon:yes stop_codon:yes gene_type:complete